MNPLPLGIVKVTISSALAYSRLSPFRFNLSPFSYPGRNINNRLHRLLHHLDRNELITAVEIHTTGKEVGARKSHERKLRAIGTTTDRLDYRNDTGLLHRALGNVNYMHLWLNHLTHVTVLLLEFKFYGTGRPYDINAFLYLDISNLVSNYPTFNTVNP